MNINVSLLFKIFLDINKYILKRINENKLYELH